MGRRSRSSEMAWASEPGTPQGVEPVGGETGGWSISGDGVGELTAGRPRRATSQSLAKDTSLVPFVEFDDRVESQAHLRLLPGRPPDSGPASAATYEAPLPSARRERGVSMVGTFDLPADRARVE